MEDNHNNDYRGKLREDAKNGFKQIKEYISLKSTDTISTKLAKILGQVLLIAFSILISPLLIIMLIIIVGAPG